MEEALWLWVAADAEGPLSYFANITTLAHHQFLLKCCFETLEQLGYVTNHFYMPLQISVTVLGMTNQTLVNV